MRAVIFVNGMIDDLTSLRAILLDDDYLIAADGGAHHCLALNLQPHVVVGDLDSLEPTLIERLTAQGVLIERHPVEKNQTDLELAIERAITDGAAEILLVGAIGGRLDQSIGNLLLLAQRDWGVSIKIVDAEQVAELLRGGGKMTFVDQIGATLSILPLSPWVTGITYQGMAYPLEKASLALGSTRGISNKIVESPATLQIDEGILLVVREIVKYEK